MWIRDVKRCELGRIWMKWPSQKGPVSMVPVVFPHITPSPLCCGPKTATVLAGAWFCFGYRPGAVRPVPSLLLFPSLTEWWRLIVQNEKAKPVRAFSSLISQVQSSSLWAGNYIWSEKKWPLATERSNKRPFQRLTTGQRLLNTTIFQSAIFTLLGIEPAGYTVL